MQVLRQEPDSAQQASPVSSQQAEIESTSVQPAFYSPNHNELNGFEVSGSVCDVGIHRSRPRTLVRSKPGLSRVGENRPGCPWRLCVTGR